MAKQMKELKQAKENVAQNTLRVIVV